MQLYNVVSSKLINDLILNTDDSSRLILAEILSAQELLGHEHLLIEIDSDDDFAVDGKSVFSQSFSLKDRDIVEVYKKAIQSIRFGHPGQENEKICRFMDLIMGDDFLNEVATGHASTGGNATIDVSIIQAPATMSIGSLVIDLTQ